MENMNIEAMNVINEEIADVATDIPAVDIAEEAVLNDASFLKNFLKVGAGAAIVAGIGFGAWKLWELRKKAKAAKAEIEQEIEGQAEEVDDEADVESEE